MGANPWESPRGVTLIFSYICKLGPFFGVQNFEFRFFGVFRKINIFFGYEIFLIILGGILDYISRSFLCILRSFLKVKVQNLGYFLGLLKFQIFFWVLEIPDIFWG